MARIYARFDHGTTPALEALTTGNFYDRRVIGATTSSATLRAGLIASRSILSNAVYSQLDDVNKNGNLGVIIPSDVITIGGGNLSFSNVYTSSIAGVVWPSDPRTRPTQSITSSTAGVGPASPVDSGTILATYYTNAANGVSDVLTNYILDQRFSYINCGPYTRLGNTPDRTLLSIWHDHDLQYFAWDDFTPGTPLNFDLNIPEAIAGTPETLYVENSDTFHVVFTWLPEYTSDRAGSAVINATTVRDDNSATIDTLTNQTITNGNLFYSWSLSGTSYGNNANGYLYDINSSIQFKDVTIPTNVSSVVNNNVNQYVRIYKVYAASLYYGADVSAVCSDTTTSTYYVDNGSNLAATNFLWSDKVGNAAPAGYYASTLPGPGTTIRSWDGGAFGSNTTCP